MVVVHTVIAIILVIALIIRLKVDPVISLIFASLYLGLAPASASPDASRRSRPASARSWPRSACSSGSGC